MLVTLAACADWSSGVGIAPPVFDFDFGTPVEAGVPVRDLGPPCETQDDDRDGLSNAIEQCCGGFAGRDEDGWLVAGVPGDLDGNGIEDFRDGDDDGDGLPDVDELGGDPRAPRDTDGDGVPDFRDTDSDGDLILDVHEFCRFGDRCGDRDEDGVPNERDLDSDGDGYSDQEEAGDGDLATPPVDTDVDGVPNFLDLDGDDDGLLDAEERELGSDPTSRDSDGDGVDDLIERSAGTDLNDPADNPRTRGFLVAVTPFRQPPAPAQLTTTLTLDVALEAELGTATPAVTQAFVDDPSDEIDASVFVADLEVDGTTEGCAMPGPEAPPGGFDALPLGATACFVLEVEPNRTLPERTTLQVVSGELRIQAEARVVATRRVVFVVPPGFEL